MISGGYPPVSPQLWHHQVVVSRKKQIEEERNLAEFEHSLLTYIHLFQF